MHTNLMFVSCSRLQIVPKIWLLLCPRSTRSKFICNLLNTHGNKPRTKHHLLNFGSAADVSCLFDALSLTCYHSLYSLFVFLGQTDKGSFWCEWTKRDNYYHSIIRLRPHHEEVCEHVYFTALFNRIIRPACTSFFAFFVSNMSLIQLIQHHFCQRIHFKIASCVFQARTGQAPTYLAYDCRLILHSDWRKLRFSDIRH